MSNNFLRIYSFNGLRLYCTFSLAIPFINNSLCFKLTFLSDLFLNPIEILNVWLKVKIRLCVIVTKKFYDYIYQFFIFVFQFYIILMYSCSNIVFDFTFHRDCVTFSFELLGMDYFIWVWVSVLLMAGI